MNNHTHTIPSAASRRNASHKRLAGLAAAAALATLAILSPAAANAGECPNEALREANSSTGLPDCRAYEKVTPEDKGDAPLGIAAPSAYAAVDGERMLYAAFGTFAGTGDASAMVPYVTNRALEGWMTTPVSPAENQGDYWILPGTASANLDQITISAIPGGELNHPAGLDTWLGLGTPGGPFTVLAVVPGAQGDALPNGASADMRHIALETSDKAALNPPATGVSSGHVLYEWSPNGLRLVGIDNAGKPLSPCGAVLGNGLGGSSRDINAVSSDGSKIFFESPDPDGGCPEPPRLYVREGGISTFEVSAPEAGVSDTPQPIVWDGSSSDGAKVFFSTTQKLTADAPEASANSVQLYEYDLSRRALSRISGGADHSQSGAVGVALVSGDGSSVYFSSTSTLVPGRGVVGQPNLFRYDTIAHSYQYVTTLAENDVVYLNSGWGAPLGPQGEDVNFYTTPNGQTLIVAKNVALGSTMSRQLFRFSSNDESFRCISCPPADVATTGDAGFVSSAMFGVNRLHHPMSDDGSYVFFDSPDQLLPPDVNQVSDVYEWHDGALSLLSDGVSTHPSFFLDASTNGHDVFFSTFAGLLPQDGDGANDIYDARIGGGYAAPTTVAGGCDGDACQGEQPHVPSFAAPSSVIVWSARSATRSHYKTFRADSLTVRQRAALAHGRRIALRVLVGGGGRVTVVLRAPLGRRGRAVVAARGSASAATAGTVYVHLQLSAQSERVLRRRGRAPARLIVRLSGVPGPQVRTTTLTLTTPTSRAEAPRRHN